MIKRIYRYCFLENTLYVFRLILVICPLLTFCLNSVDGLFPEYYFDVIKDSKIVVSDNYFVLLREINIKLFYSVLFAIAIHLLILKGYLLFFLWPIKIWISYSYQNLTPIVEGGDQINYIFSILYFFYYISELVYQKDFKLIFSFKDRSNKMLSSSNNYLVKVSVLLLKVQVSIIYLHSAFEKIKTDFWLDGSAIYYINQGNMFGWSNLTTQVNLFHAFPFLLFLLTYSVLIIEFLLGIVIFMDRKYVKFIACIGIVFHSLIIFTFGLTLFSFTMIGLIILVSSNIKINDKLYNN